MNQNTKRINNIVTNYLIYDFFGITFLTTK